MSEQPRLGLKEIGKIEHALFAVEWTKSPILRRGVTEGLNKGETQHEAEMPTV